MYIKGIITVFRVCQFLSFVLMLFMLSFSILSTAQIYEPISNSIPERPKAEIIYLPIKIDQSNAWLASPYGDEYKNYFSLDEKVCGGTPHEIERCISHYFSDKFGSADKEICRELIEDSRPGFPLNVGHPHVSDVTFDCDLYVGGLTTPASEYHSRYFNSNERRIHADFTIRYYNTYRKEWVTFSDDRLVYRFKYQIFSGIPSKIWGFDEIYGAEIRCPSPEKLDFDRLDNLHVPDVARYYYTTGDVESDESWYDIGYCSPSDKTLYEVVNLEDPLTDFLNELSSDSSQSYHHLANNQTNNEDSSYCENEYVECHEEFIPGREVSGNGNIEFKLIIDRLDFNSVWRAENVKGKINEAVYFVIDSLLKLNADFEWSFVVDNFEKSPIPENIFSLYPTLLEKLIEQPNLVQNIGTKVCYPDTDAFAVEFEGTDWQQYICGTEAESCPVENTGPECLHGNPINVRTGVKIESATDYAVSGKSQLSVKRGYSSSKSANKRGWQFTIANQALRVSGNYVKLTGRSNSNYLFNCSNTAPSNCNAQQLIGQSNKYFGYKLSNLVDGYSLTLASGAVELYNLRGQLTSITSSQGSKLTYSYQANSTTVTDEFNQQITLTTNNDNLVIQAATPVGNFIYDYDEFNRLTTVTQPDSSTIGYRYDEATHSTVQYYQSLDQTCSGDDYLTVPECKTLVKDLGLLTGKIDEKGQRYASWHYDDKQRAYKSEHGTGIDATTINFISEQGEAGTNDSGEAISLPRVRETISPLGFRTRTTFRSPSAQRAEKVEIFDVSNNLISTESYSYDSNGYEASYSDVNGLNTQYTRYSDGREYSRIENAGTADARTINTRYSGSTNKPTQITTPETRINISYINHNSGLLVSQQTTTDLSTNKQRITKFTYNTQGQLLTIDGPRNDVSDITTFEYNAQGLRSKTTNSLGHITQITEFNAFGKPITLIDENNITTTLDYDLRGRLTRMQRAGTTSTFEYDLTGNLVKTIRANGSVLEYEYDVAKRLTAIKDGANNRIEYTLDAAGNQLSTQVKDSSGTLLQTQQQLFDEFSRLVTMTNATNDATQFDYLTNGNLNKTTDASNNLTNNGYDNLQRLTEIHDAEGGKTAFAYDNAGRTTSITDATGKATTYTYNGFGELVKQVSPDSGQTTFTYDNAGNLASETDARGITVSYRYDALNRLTRTTYPDTDESIAFFYDNTANDNKGIGRLTGVVTEAGINRNYHYGELGQLLTESYIIDTLAGSQNYNLSYQYDVAGQSTGMTYPSGRTLTYTLNSDGQITAVTTLASGQNQTSQSLVSNASYLPFGPLSGFSYGNGLINSYNYDQNYRLTEHTLTGLKNETLSYTNVGNINAISDSINNTNNVTFGYDKLSRLLTSADNNSADTSGDFIFTYDAIGNRQSKLNNDTTEDYSYIANTHHLEKVTIDKLVRVPSFDSSFNQARRMASTTYHGVTTQYQYDYRELRVSKTITDTPTAVIHYHYDASGLLIAESDGNGVWLKEYVYFNGQLIAMVDFDNGVVQPAYAVHNDHLGTPTQITNRTGTLVWQATYSPFGLATINNDVDGELVEGKSTPVELNIRFPGQYYDAETKLHYNWHRYYDPKVGRYITSDPLGLSAGINTYGYVGGNPVGNIDPEGLISIARPWLPLGGSSSSSGNSSGPALPSLPAHIQNAINGGSSSSLSNTKSSESSCDDEDKCKATDTREEAKRKAYNHAGIGTFTSKKKIPWNDLRNKADREVKEAYLKLLTQGVNEMGYSDADNYESRVTEHPGGHPHLRGKKDPKHHWCSHFHAKNKFGMDEVFPYKKM